MFERIILKSKRNWMQINILNFKFHYPVNPVIMSKKRENNVI